jgi:DNA polymerase III delta subunit
MILLLHGGDALAIRRRLQQLKDEADGRSGMLATNFSEIEGREAKPQDILAPCMTPPFLAPHRLVVVDHFLERYDPREGRPPRSAEPFAPMLAGLRAGIPETTILVFLGSELNNRNSMLDALAKIPGVQNEAHAPLKPAEVPRYIREEANARGIRFRSGASRQAHDQNEAWLAEDASDPASLLGTLTQADTLRIANELDKLALYSSGREVTVDDIYEVCAGEREANGYKLTDAVMDGRHLQALEALALLQRDGESLQGLLGLLISGYRTLATVIDMLDAGATPDEIGKAIRRPWPKLRDDAIRRARRLGRDGLEAAYEALLEADRRPKLGEIDDDLALELLIARLTHLRAAPAQRAG